MYALLFIAVTAGNGTPTHLASYNTEQACQKAIRTIYEAKTIPKGVVLTQQTIDSLEKTVDITLRYQRDYQCLPIDAN